MPVPVVMDDYLVAMSCEVGFIIQPAGLVAHSPRRILQYFGTEYARRVGDGYWVARHLVSGRWNSPRSMITGESQMSASIVSLLST